MNFYKQNKNRHLGVHLSIAGGVHNALETAKKLKINAIQIFLKNNNQWQGATLKEKDIENYHSIKKSIEDVKIFAHTGYLVNLAGDGDNHKKSIASLEDDLHRATLLHVEGIVLHPGSHIGKGEKAGLKKIVTSLDSVLKNNPSNSKILLETSAGQGTSLGKTLEQLSFIIAQSKYPEKLAVCIDTCHIFAAGYDFRTPESAANFINDFNSIIGLEKLALIHLNDSKTEFNSRRDRHEHIGKGSIGTKGFKSLLNQNELIQVPLILETPKINNNEADKKNLATIRRLLQ